ncbi:hypothetical protein RHGRI_009448 [Rhododendron griersonianum]|uniref:Mo25-like protein n=1 Tax=Rhododendron griersonianum TaxID=479676 RepID=A0AAV6KES7_9ERIC|nr:hypothetical protein RHGRI_009448 [Rhododendron griersonianum]
MEKLMIAKIDKSQKIPQKPTPALKKAFLRALRKSAPLKCLFKPTPRTPADVVRRARFLLLYLDSNSECGGGGGGIKHVEKMAELNKLIRELKTILYGNNESEPAAEACAQLTQEFFSENTFRLLIICLPKLDLEGRKDATQVVASLQRQRVRSRLIASDYLEDNLDLMDHLISGYEDQGVALHYGTMLRECIRHQSVARYVLNSKCMKKFFDYIQLPNFDVAADAIATFKFFAEFNSKLLESTNYVTRRQAVKLLGDILLERSNSSVMVHYVSSKDNLRISMNLLREPSKNIQIDAFHVFKLFAANKNKPPGIANIFVANRSKILRFFSDFKIDRGVFGDTSEDEQFEADKAQVIREIAQVECKDGDLANERLLKTY